MQKIPVTKDGRRGSDVIIIDSSEVVRIDKVKEHEYIIHTKEDQYYLDLSFDSLEEWLFEDGFRLLDSTNIVNMNQVTHYDANRGTVYLGDQRNKKTKTASAARIHKEHIETVMELLSISGSNNKRENEDSAAEGIAQSISSQVHDDKFLRSYATIRSVTERKKAEEQIVHMAYHDALTNLPNRQLLHNRLNQMFAEAEQNGKMTAVIFFDLDRFKIINDTLGHPVGDEILKFLAKKLRTHIRESDMVARFSGDEFIILLSNLNHIDEATNFAKEIPHYLFSEPFVYENHELYLTASLGISLFPNDGTDAATLLKNADTAMYRAKGKGGSTYQLYRADMNHRSMERLSLEVSLHKALERNEISIYYQPLVELQTGSIIGMESLVRWKHPEWGMVPPADFIPLAEETGLIVPIGNWMLKQACLQNTIWQRMGYGPLCVSVNISVNQFQQPAFIQFIGQTLQETGLQPDLLCLEITESVAMKNVSYIVDTMAKLKQLGLQISIDDFGTGYSSLSYLKRFRIHTLKIDQSFIRDVTHDEDTAAIVTALIAMSQQLKIKSLAEGVETKEQLAFLKSKGCNEIQGYIFSRPLPAAEFEYLLMENKNLYSVPH